MTKCLINCRYTLVASWVSQCFPGQNPYLLNICGKPLLEYYIDFCSLVGIHDICIVQDEPDIELEQYFSSGNQWGLNLQYGIANPDDSLYTILKKNTKFISTSDLLIIDDFLFIHYDKKELADYPFPKDKHSCIRLADSQGGLLHLPADFTQEDTIYNALPSTDITGVTLTPISSVKEYYEISQHIIQHSNKHFVIPGYHNEDNTYIGQNVEICNNTKVENPVFIGNNVQLKQLAMVGPNAIIGNNVIIDTATTIEESIVFSNSYIGSDLEIRNKIVYRNLLIDPDTGNRVEIVDFFLISTVNVSGFYRFFYKLCQQVIAALILLCQLPFWLIFQLLFIIFTAPQKVQETYYLHKEKSLKITRHKPLTDRFLHRLFRRLSLDKFNLLVKSLLGLLFLGGNKLLQANVENMKLIDEMPSYHPAVFSYSELLSDQNDDWYQERLNELYYSHNQTLKSDITIAIKCLIKRLLG